MNRIIKFRVWNKKTNNWVQGCGRHENPSLDGVNLFGETILLGGFMNGVSIEDLDDCETLQFTGLKDKNGKEIFEGDILECDYGEYRGLGKVIYTMQGFYIESRYGVLIQDTVPTMKYSNIIGNIFENPELLTTETVTPTTIIKDAHEEYLKTIPQFLQNERNKNDYY